MEKLNAWLNDREHGVVLDLARSLGVHQATVWRWRTGKSRPSDPQKTAIRNLTGIPESAWFPPEGAS